jgi:hypothetical protein
MLYESEYIKHIDMKQCIGQGNNINKRSAIWHSEKGKVVREIILTLIMFSRKYKQKLLRDLIKDAYLNDILSRPSKRLRYSKKLTKTSSII